jgi:hypothetical protein
MRRVNKSRIYSAEDFNLKGCEKKVADLLIEKGKLYRLTSSGADFMFMNGRGTFLIEVKTKLSRFNFMTAVVQLLFGRDVIDRDSIGHSIDYLRIYTSEVRLNESDKYFWRYLNHFDISVFDLNDNIITEESISGMR